LRKSLFHFEEVSMQRGKFVVISGPDGAGKTTLIQKIRELYGDALVYVREPGGTDLSEAIRQELFSPEAKEWNPITQFLHFFCARANLIARVINGERNRGRGVLADRFAESTFAYQVVAFQNRELAPLFWEVYETLLVEYGEQPDLYIYIDVPVEVGVMRRAKDKGTPMTHFDSRPDEFHQMVASGLKEFFEKVPHVTVDGTQSQEKVLSDVLEILKPIFGDPTEGPER